MWEAVWPRVLDGCGSLARVELTASRDPAAQPSDTQVWYQQRRKMEELHIAAGDM